MLSREDVVRGLTQFAEALDADDVNVHVHGRIDVSRIGHTVVVTVSAAQSL